MPKSLMFFVQMFPFFSGFFVCAAVSQLIRNASSTLWIDFSMLAVVFLLWSRQYAAKLRRQFPPHTNPVNE